MLVSGELAMLGRDQDFSLRRMASTEYKLYEKIGESEHS